MSVDTFSTIGTFPEPTILIAFNSIKEKFANLLNQKSEVQDWNNDTGSP